MILTSRHVKPKQFHMYSSEDFENFFVRYKAEGLPRKLSVKEFCIRNNVPFNLFDKWYRDTRHRIVPVNVEGKPDDGTDAPVISKESQTLSAEPARSEVLSMGDLRIMVDIRMTNGMHIRQKNLNYEALRGLVEKLEVLC